MKKRRTVRCSKCHRTGHNKKTCGVPQHKVHRNTSIREKTFNDDFLRTVQHKTVPVKKAHHPPLSGEGIAVGMKENVFQQTVTQKATNPAYPEYITIEAEDIAWEVLHPDALNLHRDNKNIDLSQPSQFLPAGYGGNIYSDGALAGVSIKKALAGRYGIVEETPKHRIDDLLHKNVFYFNPEGFLHRLNGPALTFVYKDGSSPEEFWAGGIKGQNHEICEKVIKNEITADDLKNLTTHDDPVVRNMAAYSLLTRVRDDFDPAFLYGILTQKYASKQVQEMVVTHRNSPPEWQIILDIMDA